MRASFGAAVATGLATAVLCLVVFMENVRQAPIEAAGKVRVFPMKQWQLSGPEARKQMSTYFSRENFNAEATHLANFVDNHPFFGKGSGRFMLSGNKKPTFAVVGFGKPRVPRHSAFARAQHAPVAHKPLRSVHLLHRQNK